VIQRRGIAADPPDRLPVGRRLTDFVFEIRAHVSSFGFGRTARAAYAELEAL
jgi:hypothetical protein